MAHELVREVFDLAPADVTGPDLVVLLAIAEHAQPDDRPGWPARTWGGDLAAAARVNPTSLGRVLQRLRDRHLEVRVPIGADASGRVVFARRGVASTYRLPDLEALAASEGRTSVRPVIDRKHVGQSDARPTETVRSDPRPAMTTVSPDPRPAVETVRPDPRPRLAGPTSGPNQKNQKSMHAAVPSDHDEPASPSVDDQLVVVRTATTAGIVGVILEQPYGSVLDGRDRYAEQLRGRGWDAPALAARFREHPVVGARGAGLLRTRLQELLTLPGPTSARGGIPSSSSRPTWCGACDESTRFIEDSDGNPRRCPECHPSSRRSAA